MAKLIELSKANREHWELHLNACLKDTPSLRKEIRVFLRNGDLPNLKHPSFIHDWLEKPEERPTIEALDG